LKQDNFHKLYYDDSQLQMLTSPPAGLYNDLGDLKIFIETHPKVMQDRINNSHFKFDSKIDEQYPDWIRKILMFLYPVTKRISKLLTKRKVV